MHETRIRSISEVKSHKSTPGTWLPSISRASTRGNPEAFGPPRKSSPYFEKCPSPRAKPKRTIYARMFGLLLALCFRASQSPPEFFLVSSFVERQILCRRGINLREDRLVDWESSVAVKILGRNDNVIATSTILEPNALSEQERTA